MTAALRTGVTLAVLALMLVLGVTWGFHQAIKPFPKESAPAICTPTDYAKGDKLSSSEVTVNVLNASTREGLAGRTMQLLGDQGFDTGVVRNAPADTQVSSAEIWTSDRKNPGVRMLRSFVGKVPIRVLASPPYAGLSLVVGDQFGALAAGKTSLTLRRSASVCTPPAS